MLNYCTLSYNFIIYDFVCILVRGGLGFVLYKIELLKKKLLYLTIV
jgi:hypothetical protein